jgi:hypothetical protein
MWTFKMYSRNTKTTNETTASNNKSDRPQDSRLYLDISRSFKLKESFIFRYFKVFQVSQIFTCGLSDLLLLAVGSLVVLFEEWIIFKNLQFILLFLSIWTLTFYCFRLKNAFYLLLGFRVSNHCGHYRSLSFYKIQIIQK